MTEQGDGGDLRLVYYNQPLMVSDDVARYLQANSHVAMKRNSADAAQEVALIDFDSVLQSEQRRPYRLENGVAIITIKGSLEHDSHYYGNYWTGYNALRTRYDMALKDPAVKGIAFLVNSGGGMVSGNFDLVDHIYKHRGDKPTLAIVDEHAYSAAYSLASAAERIEIARTGGAGSIGVQTVHYDFSRALDSDGITATIFRAGKHKAKPNMLEALDAATIDRIQGSIEHTNDIFIATVARNRGLNSDDVRNTEAATFGAEEAIELGLADAVQAPLEALEAFKRELSSSTMIGATVMTTETLPAANAQPGQAATTHTQAQLDTAAADAKAAGIEQGASTERERIFAILDCEQATGRAASAAHLAKQPGMTAETAAEILGGLPETAASTESAGSDALDQAMALTGGGAGVGAGEGEGADAGDGFDAFAMLGKSQQNQQPRRY